MSDLFLWFLASSLSITITKLFKNSEKPNKVFAFEFVLSHTPMVFSRFFVHCFDSIIARMRRSRNKKIAMKKQNNPTLKLKILLIPSIKTSQIFENIKGIMHSIIASSYEKNKQKKPLIAN